MLGLIKKGFGLLTAPEWTLASIAVRLVAFLAATGGAWYAIDTAWTNWTASLCDARVSDITSAVKDKTIATLEAELKAKAATLDNLEKRRVDDMAAVEMASSQAKAAMDELKALSETEKPVLIPDSHVDIINGVLSGKSSGSTAKSKLGGS
ncbi:hypothetical protein [Hyphomicrobium sp.]|uniref:hypothetical protein n=1 Tax=Hyphomicrobium sp. TaxID=82 RepID=UPI001D81A186|nr:hypothetical protein [Hyphomicrobium sp.]MBY0559884.1 hypothetical protein [Hyphomicrobium sp.]